MNTSHNTQYIGIEMFMNSSIILYSGSVYNFPMLYMKEPDLPAFYGNGLDWFSQI